MIFQDIKDVSGNIYDTSASFLPMHNVHTPVAVPSSIKSLQTQCRQISQKLTRAERSGVCGQMSCCQLITAMCSPSPHARREVCHVGTTAYSSSSKLYSKSTDTMMTNVTNTDQGRKIRGLRADLIIVHTLCNCAHRPRAS